MAGNIISGDAILFKSPNPTESSNDRQASTTSYLYDKMIGSATKESPNFTGNPTSVSPSISDVSDTIATSEYLKQVIAGIFQDITPPSISIPTSVASGSKLNRMVLSGGQSPSGSAVRYTIIPGPGLKFTFSRTSGIFDNETVFFDAPLSTNDTMVNFQITSTDGVSVGVPMNVGVLVRAYTG